MSERRRAAAPAAEDPGAMSFEAAMAALEEIVERLESGDTPLEESIALYERGASLREHCEKKLSDAELRVRRIVAGPEGEAAGTEPFDAAPGAPAAGR